MSTTNVNEILLEEMIRHIEKARLTGEPSVLDFTKIF